MKIGRTIIQLWILNRKVFTMFQLRTSKMDVVVFTRLHQTTVLVVVLSQALYLQQFLIVLREYSKRFTNSDFLVRSLVFFHCLIKEIPPNINGMPVCFKYINIYIYIYIYLSLSIYIYIYIYIIVFM